MEYPAVMTSVDRSIVVGFIPALKREAFALNFSNQPRDRDHRDGWGCASVRHTVGIGGGTAGGRTYIAVLGVFQRLLC